MKKTIEIPEGYEARIEGNKVIIQLKETEDEKIRKQLIDEVKEQINNIPAPDCCNSDDLKRLTILESWLAYLERQKEQKLVGVEKVTHPLYVEGFEAGKEVGAQAEALKHIHTEWSEDTRNWKNIAYYVLKEWLGIGQYLDNPALDKIAEELQKRYGPVKHISISEWSEEDTCILEDAVTAVDLLGNDDEYSKTHPNLAKAFRAAKDWLKALPERFNLQSKQEWDEEEMKVLNSIIDDYEKAAKSFCGYDGKIMLLKAIRDGEYDLSKQEWCEEDEEMLRIISNRVEKANEWATEQGYPIDDPTMKQSPIDWLKYLPERFSLQPKLKWNEEDEWKRNELLKYLEEKGDYRSTWYSWLKSFPERFNLQPKQEWSEESRKRLDRIQMVLESWDRSHTSLAGLPSTIPDDINWLKSLRPS